MKLKICKNAQKKNKNCAVMRKIDKVYNDKKLAK